MSTLLLALSLETLSTSETIVVSGRREPPLSASFETRHGLDAEAIDALDGRSADEIVRRLPSVHVPTNSRGEAIAFLRNAGERQVALFFEGVALNVPWDNRLDISLIPVPLLLGGVRTATGPLAPHYGVNALGAVSLSAADSLSARIATGSGRLPHAEAALPLGPLIVGGSWSQRRGERLSDAADLPFSQDDGALRTNTDRRLGSLFARLRHAPGAHDIGLTAFQVWGEKGIAPESDRASGARFWRYPEVRHTLVAADATSSLGPATELASALWYQRFGQTIDSYSGADYATVEARQVDRDETWGVRELLKHRAGPMNFVGSVNFLHSTHRQRDAAYTDGAAPALLPDALVYSQRNWSIGGEVEYAFSASLFGEIGLGYDKVDYVRTGDKPPIRDARGWTGRVGAVWDVGQGWRLRAAAGRKLRAPTMRELFGQAVGRFLINPDLRPERIVTAELGAEWRGSQGGVYVVPFVQDVKDTIDQRNVGRLRQRINLPGSAVQGVELGGDWRPHRRLALSGNATWTRVRRKDPPSGQVDRIAEKPALLARLRADYEHPSGFSTGVEVEHVGRAWSADEGGALVPLERSTAFNWRVGHSFNLPREREAELFVHVDNLTDTLIDLQHGLPGPGRTIRVGVKIG